MSPEELQAAISLNNMDAFKQMDVYSMGLVLWEIISRCVFVVTGTERKQYFLLKSRGITCSKTEKDREGGEGGKERLEGGSWKVQGRRGGE